MKTKTSTHWSFSFLTTAVIASVLMVTTGCHLNTPMTKQASEAWHTDYQAALKEAAKEHKQVLLDFTGSDWCGWCQRLKSELFDQEAFKKYADKNLVLVEVDFPQSKELPAALQAQNKELEARYHVTGFPTLILLDPQENVIKEQSGYLAGGPAAFIDWVESASKKTEATSESAQ